MFNVVLESVSCRSFVVEEIWCFDLWSGFRSVVWFIYGYILLYIEHNIYLYIYIYIIVILSFYYTTILYSTLIYCYITLFLCYTLYY